MSDHADVLRDLLMEMGIKGAEHLTPFALACLGAFLRDWNDASSWTGTYPKPRAEWARLRLQSEMLLGFGLPLLHAEALEWNRRIKRSGQYSRNTSLRGRRVDHNILDEASELPAD